MNEKRFYHMALEGALLNGKVEKQKLYARIAKEQASSPAPMRTQTARRPIPWYAFAAAAALLVLTLTIGFTVGRLNNRPVTMPGQSAETAAPETQTGEAINLGQVLYIPHNPTLTDESVEIKLLPELEDAAVYAEYRQREGQPAFTEADWGWLKNLTVSVEQVMLTDGTLTWTNRIGTAHPDTFLAAYGAAQSEQTADILPEDAFCESSETDGVCDLGGLGGGMLSDANGLILVAETDLDTIERPLPEEGTVTVTETLRVVDCRIDSMGTVGTLAVITHRFSFDVGTLTDTAQGGTVTVSLSGEHLLTQYREGNRKNGMVSLDGVTLKGSVRYTQMGVLLGFSLDSAPASWDRWDMYALTPALRSDSRAPMTLLTYSVNGGEAQPAEQKYDADKNRITGFLIPIAPSDYVGITDLKVTLWAQHIASVNGEPVGADWFLSADAPEPDALAFAAEPVVTFDLPLP